MDGESGELTGPPSTSSHRQASHGHFPYTAHNFENAPSHPPVTGQQHAHTRPDGRSHYVVISWNGRNLVTRVRVMLP